MRRALQRTSTLFASLATIPSRVRLGLSLSWADGVLVLLAVLLGVPSLYFPFSHDTGLYHYVAREWVLHGRVPYRDLFDHKTPGIYAVYGLGILLFGPSQYSSRVLDIMCVLALGVVSSLVVTPQGRRPPQGLIGLSCLCASTLHYGIYIYWDTGESELWYVTLALAAVAAIRRGDGSRRSLLGAGLLAGGALLLKPVAIFPALASVVALLTDGAVRRVQPSMTRAVALYVAGGTLPAVTTLVYFGAAGALPDMFDIVVRANAFYVAHERVDRTYLELAKWTFEPFRHAWNALLPASYAVALLITASAISSLARRDRDRIGVLSLAALLLLGSTIAIAVQGKFWPMHWVALVGPWTTIIAFAAHRALTVRCISEERTPLLALALALFGLGTFSLTPAYATNWSASARLAWQLSTGAITRREYAAHYSFAQYNYAAQDFEAAAYWLQDNSQPVDNILVRGFHVGVYNVAQRSYSGRFFWSPFLTYPSRAYRRDEFLEEDRREMERHPPRFIAVSTYEPDGVDSVPYYERLGYRVRERFGLLTVLER